MIPNECFVQHLHSEFSRRSKRNPRFSIRAFARQLGLEPSSLAQILSGKRKLTDKMCHRLAPCLNLSPRKINTLMKSIPAVSQSYPNFKLLNEDSFKVISDWHYFAILELTRIEGFKSDVQYVARSLGLTNAVASASIERLKRLGYLAVDSQNNWTDALDSTVNSGNQHTAPAFAEHQRQLLQKATFALDDVEYSKRVQSSMVLCGSKARVAEAKQRILNFIEEIDEFLKSGESRDEVLALSVSLFPLTQSSHQSEPLS